MQHNLNCIIVTQAAALARSIGFTYAAVDIAPASYPELVKAYNASQLSKSPLPVFNGGSDSTIYGDAEVNYAFRFWHDVEHVRGKNDFSPQGELLTAQAQLNALNMIYGYGPNTIEYKLLHADIIGQVEYFQKYGTFPENQKEFVLSYVGIL